MKKSVLAVLASYVMWGLLPIFWKLLHVNSVYILANRILWSCVFCFLLLLLMRQKQELKAVFSNGRELLLLFLSGLAITVNWGSYIYCMSSGHITDAALAYFINPLFSVLAGFLIYREQLSALQWISVSIALAGVVVTSVLFHTIPVYALVVALTFTTYGALKKRVKASGVASTGVETLLVLPIALAILLYFQFTGKVRMEDFDLKTIFLLICTGVVTSTPLLLYSAGIKKTPYALSGILMFINPTLVLLIGLLYGETIQLPLQILFLFVWVALILFVADGLLKAKKKQHR